MFGALNVLTFEDHGLIVHGHRDIAEFSLDGCDRCIEHMGAVAPLYVHNCTAIKPGGEYGSGTGVQLCVECVASLVDGEPDSHWEFES